MLCSIDDKGAVFLWTINKKDDGESYSELSLAEQNLKTAHLLRQLQIESRGRLLLRPNDTVIWSHSTHGLYYFQVMQLQYIPITAKIAQLVAMGRCDYVDLVYARNIILGSLVEEGLLEPWELTHFQSLTHITTTLTHEAATWSRMAFSKSLSLSLKHESLQEKIKERRRLRQRH